MGHLSEQYLGQRIERARQRVGLSQGQLADAVGLGQSAISRVESGQRAVGSLELASIADRLGVTILDLLEAQPLAEELRVAARVGESTPEGAELALGRVVDLVRFAQLLDELGEGAAQPARSWQPPLAAGASSVSQGAGLADWARTTWGLDDDPLSNLFSVIEEQAGLPIALEPLNERVAGLVAHLGGTAIALVDSSVAWGRQRFTAAHELCHFLCGDGGPLLIDQTLFGDASEERRANAFAAHFLMPEQAVRRYLRGREIDERVVVELQFTFGVSLDALLWHLLNLQLLSAERRASIAASGARALASRYGFRAEWGQAESQRGVRRPPALLYERAVDAYAHGRIGIEAIGDLAGRADVAVLRRELEDSGVAYDEGWWDTEAEA